MKMHPMGGEGFGRGARARAHSPRVRAQRCARCVRVRVCVRVCARADVRWRARVWRRPHRARRPRPPPATAAEAMASDGNQRLNEGELLRSMYHYLPGQGQLYCASLEGGQPPEGAAARAAKGKPAPRAQVRARHACARARARARLASRHLLSPVRSHATRSCTRTSACTHTHAHAHAYAHTAWRGGQRASRQAVRERHLVRPRRDGQGPAHVRPRPRGLPRRRQEHAQRGAHGGRQDAAQRAARWRGGRT